jgi:hypothetical protein
LRGPIGGNTVREKTLLHRPARPAPRRSTRSSSSRQRAGRKSPRPRSRLRSQRRSPASRRRSRLSRKTKPTAAPSIAPPQNHAAESSNEFAPSKANPHLALRRHGALSRQHSTVQSRPVLTFRRGRAGSRLLCHDHPPSRDARETMVILDRHHQRGRGSHEGLGSEGCDAPASGGSSQ